MSYMSDLYAAMSALETNMVAVAAAMGSEWSFKPVDGEYQSTHCVGDLLGPNNTKLGVYRIACGARAGRLQIRGEYNRIVGYDRSSNMVAHLTYPAITVAHTRHADAVAADIVKRLLPKYLPLFVQVQEDIAANTRYQETGEATAKRLSALVGSTYRHDGRGTYTIRMYSLPQGRGYGDIEISGKHVSIHVRGTTADVVASFLPTLMERSCE